MSVRGYWREAFECAFDDAGLYSLIEPLTDEQRDHIARVLEGAADNVGQAFHVPENPMIAENERLARRLKWTRELEHCRPCAGTGRIEGRAGPWWTNSQCDTCHGAGKVHPCNEREPA